MGNWNNIDKLFDIDQKELLTTGAETWCHDFRDYFGFVSSVRVSINDMVRSGDWILMDKFGADERCDWNQFCCIRV
jgi:hypothetical protein